MKREEFPLFFVIDMLIKITILLNKIKKYGI